MWRVISLFYRVNITVQIDFGIKQSLMEWKIRPTEIRCHRFNYSDGHGEIFSQKGVNYIINIYCVLTGSSGDDEPRSGQEWIIMNGITL